MTNYIILALVSVIIISYLFDITSRYTKIPGVVLLITLGILLQPLASATGLNLPNFQPVLPVLGTLGLVLIVMEASLDLKIEKQNTRMLGKSLVSSLVLFLIFVSISALLLILVTGSATRAAILNSIPLGIISSAVAISSSSNLGAGHRDFIVFESSMSDIIGIMAFDFILYDIAGSAGGAGSFILKMIGTIILAIVTTSALALMMHRITYHVNYVIILSAMMLIYVLAKLFHLPALLLVLVFGLVLANNRFAEATPISKFVDFVKFRSDLEAFKTIIREMTFLVKSFFFIIFGYYTPIGNILNPDNFLIALIIISGIYITRWLFFRFVLRMNDISLILFAPRGLITILLFFSIPDLLKIPVIGSGVVTLVIILTLLIMTAGNFFVNKTQSKTITDDIGNGPDSIER